MTSIINEQLKANEWRGLISLQDKTGGDVVKLLTETYGLEDYISDRLELYHISKVGNDGNTKQISIKDEEEYTVCKIRTHNNKNVPPRTVVIDDVFVHVRNNVGDEVEEDCSCDSEYMLGAMDRVGGCI